MLAASLHLNQLVIDRQARGMSNAEVAETLVISPLTVNVHLRSIYRKLDVSSRTAAARLAIDHQLI
jgi:DNA-binding NarL/FixJ family response regulator